MDPKIVEQALRAILEKSKNDEPPPLPDFHLPPPPFTRGKSVPIVAHAPLLAGVRLRYRRVNQAEAWQTIDMPRQRGDFFVEILAAYADSPFPLQYYFQTRDKDGGVQLNPGLRPGWYGQPYYVVRQAV